MRHRIHIDDGSERGDEQQTPDAVAAQEPAEQPAETGADSEDARAAASAAATASASSGTDQEIASLGQEVERLRKELAEQKDTYLRSVADYQNSRRRLEERAIEERKFANREFVIALLPVVDDFERALAAAEKNENYAALVDGVRLTLRKLHGFLQKQGVENIETEGQEFDPNLHEAVMRVEDGEHPENSIVEELQRGYRMHDRVLRPSLVKVAKSG